MSTKNIENYSYIMKLSSGLELLGTTLCPFNEINEFVAQTCSHKYDSKQVNSNLFTSNVINIVCVQNMAFPMREFTML